jgi:hypothetical protein
MTIDIDTLTANLRLSSESAIRIFPHDAMTKIALSPRNSFIGFFENYVPLPLSGLLDTSTLKKIDANYIDSIMRERRGDLKFSSSILGHPLSPGATIYIEHLSSTDRAIILRFLELATIDIFKTDRRPGSDFSLPYFRTPICIVIYTGHEPWEEIIELRDHLCPLDSLLADYSLNYRATLIDLSKIPIKELGGPPLLRASMTALKLGADMLPHNFCDIYGYIGWS